MHIDRKDTDHLMDSYFTETRKTASLRYLRGRRRIGKSTLLKKIYEKNKSKCFYFSGALDEKTSRTIQRWVQEWSKLYPQTQLIKYSKNNLNWKVLFEDIALLAKDSKSPLIILLDEIQWLAKSQSGFVSLFKESWLELEKHPQLKFILCGSSNKFFIENSGGEEKILRGLVTHSELWLEDLTLHDLHKNFAPHWSLEEVCLGSILLGGIPYYWQQIPEDRSFIQSINEIFFSPNTIFLKEVDEILNLEFNKAGLKTVKLILNTIGIHPATATQITEKTRLPLTTVIDTIEKLVDYEILFAENNVAKKIKKNFRGTNYQILDPYLNFYFAILSKYRRKILENENQQLIFNTLIHSENGLSVLNYSGYAFEKFILRLLKKDQNRTESIFSELDIKNCDYQVGTYRDETKQIDIILNNCSDKLDRLIECRWTHNTTSILQLISDFSNKTISFEKSRKYIITNCPLTEKIKIMAKNNKIKVIGLLSL